MSEEELKIIQMLKEKIELKKDTNDIKTFVYLSDLKALLELVDKQYKKIEKVGDYIQQEIWLCEHDIEDCCDDEQEIRKHFVERKKILEEIQNKIWEE